MVTSAPRVDNVARVNRTTGSRIAEVAEVSAGPAPPVESSIVRVLNTYRSLASSWGRRQGTKRHTFRQAVHLVLRAIARSPTLSSVMIMKGGILLAIRHHSTRFARDIDFSTPERIQDIELPKLLREIAAALEPRSSDNEYGLALLVQSYEVKPPNHPNVTFPTLKLRIGYADRRHARNLQRLQNKQSVDVVDVDYSFNEWVSDVEQAEVDGGRLSIYPFHDLIAEKLRSVLQQVIRKRDRFQDIYDLFLLLEEGAEITREDRATILEKLRASGQDREISIHREAMRDPEIVERSRRGYDTELPGLVQGDVPEFGGRMRRSRASTRVCHGSRRRHPPTRQRSCPAGRRVTQGRGMPRKHWTKGPPGRPLEPSDRVLILGEPTRRLVVDVPERLHRRMREACAREGRDLSSDPPRP